MIHEIRMQPTGGVRRVEGEPYPLWPLGGERFFLRLDTELDVLIVTEAVTGWDAFRTWASAAEADPDGAERELAHGPRHLEGIATPRGWLNVLQRPANQARLLCMQLWARMAGMELNRPAEGGRE